MVLLQNPVLLALTLVSAVALIVTSGCNRAQTTPTHAEADRATREGRFAEAQSPTLTHALSADPTVTDPTATDLTVTDSTVADSTVTPAAVAPIATLIPMPTAIPLTPTDANDSTLKASTAESAVVVQAALPAVELTGFRHMWQTWNNCGPATLAMNLSYFGSRLDQAEIGAILRRHEDDKNVGPTELVAFAESQGYRAQLRVNGDAELMRLLLSNGIPVIIETWLEEEPNDGLGHYRMLTGYDDVTQQWIAYDSYVSRNLRAADGTYRGISLPHGELMKLWKVFNHTYLLIYTPEQVPIVQAIYGDRLQPAVMWQETLAANQAATAATPDDAFAWFNLGSTLTELGDYAGAAQAFDRARALGLPWRMLWYQFGPFEAYHAMGRAQDLLAMADATLAMTNSIEEIHYWRAQALLALNDVAAARQSLSTALALNPSYEPAADLLKTLPQ